MQLLNTFRRRQRYVSFADMTRYRVVDTSNGKIVTVISPGPIRAPGCVYFLPRWLDYALRFFSSRLDVFWLKKSDFDDDFARNVFNDGSDDESVMSLTSFRRESDLIDSESDVDLESDVSEEPESGRSGDREQSC